MSKRNAGRRALSPEEEVKTFGAGLNFAAAEAYRLLRTNLLFALPYASLQNGETCRIVGVTSSLSGEGKSTTTLNLGYVLAESGKKVLVVEADMRLPTISTRLKIEQKTGLSSLLAGLCAESDVIRPSGIQEHLWVMSAGPTPPNPSELLGSEHMKTVLKNLGPRFDFILLDLPPVNEVSDALVTSRLTHGIIVVVRKGYATRSSVAEAIRQLDHVNAKVMGFVMTYTDSTEKKYKSAYQGKYGYAAASKGAGG